jgi:hypothetical protein
MSRLVIKWYRKSVTYVSEHVLPISPVYTGRRAGDEGLGENLFSNLANGGRVAFNDNYQLGERTVSPHPNPLPVGEGRKK